MDDNEVDVEELQRFRAEAAELLGIGVEAELNENLVPSEETESAEPEETMEESEPESEKPEAQPP